MDTDSAAVDLGWIFEGPIEAVIRANIMAAKQFVEFLKVEGFLPADGDPGQMWGELRMVTFSFELPGDASALPVKRFFRVPFLSLIPLPLLEVKTATFDFGVRLLGMFDEHSPKAISLMRIGEEPLPPPRGRWHGLLAEGGPRQGTETRPDVAPHLAANMDVKVAVGQADIPAGIRNMLAVLGENAQLASTVIVLNPQTVHMSPSQARAAVTLSLKSQTRRKSHGVPVTVTYRERGLYLVTGGLPGGDGLALWRSGTRRHTDRHGRIAFEVIWDEREALEADDMSFTFATDVDDVDAEADLYCTFKRNKAGERLAP